MREHEKQIRSVRLETDIEGTLTFRGEETPVRIFNVSMGGVALETKLLLLEGDLVQVRFKPPRDQIVPVEFWGAVKNAGVGRVGVEYDEISATDRARIEAWVKDCALSSALGRECK